MQGGCGKLDVAVDHDEPDISNAVRAVARRYHNPTKRHWKQL